MASTDLEKAPLLENQAGSGSGQPTDEPTLAELQQNVFKAQRAYMRAWSRSTSGKWHKRIMIGVTALLLLFMFFCIGIITNEALNEDDPSSYGSGKIPLEAFIMSKCPDAKDCLHDMVVPAMQSVSHKVDFKLSYIGTVTDHDDGVSCKHGPQECLGNIIELCAAHIYPDPKINLGFTMCMTNQYQDIPQKELIQECALEHGMSFDKLNECATHEDGSLSVSMLKSSFNRTAELGITTSCTVTVGDDIFAIRDDGKWKNTVNGTTAADLVAEVNRRYRPGAMYGDW